MIFIKIIPLQSDRKSTLNESLFLFKSLFLLNKTLTEKICRKLKCFNFASLVQSSTKRWLKNQKISSWTLEFFGSRSDKEQRRLTESEMCKVFAEQWACLMPGYPHSGSGW